MTILNFWCPGGEDLLLQVQYAGEAHVPCISKAGEVVACATGRDAEQSFLDLWRAPKPYADPRDMGTGPLRDRFVARRFRTGSARPPMGVSVFFVEDGTAPEVARAAVARTAGVPVGVVEEVALER